MGAKLSFELDAGKILAKLHRGACQTHEDKEKVLYFNTGVTDDAKLKPEEVDKNKINFDMEGGEYELGIILSKEATLELAGSAGKLDVGKNKKLADALAAFCKELDGKMQKLAADKKNEKLKDDLEQFKDDEWKKMFDAACGASPDIKDAVENEEQFKRLVKEQYAEYVKTRGKDDKDDEDGKAEDKEDSKGEDKKDGGKESDKPGDDKNTPITQGGSLEKKTNESMLREDYTKMDPEQNPVSMATLELALANPEQAKIDKLAKEAPDSAKQAIQNNRDEVKKFMETNMKNACAYLNDYLKTFAGEDAAVVKPDDVHVTYVPENFADPYKNKKYDRYQIPALTDEQVRQEKIKQLQAKQADPEHTEITFTNMCFKVAYSLDIGK